MRCGTTLTHDTDSPPITNVETRVDTLLRASPPFVEHHWARARLKARAVCKIAECSALTLDEDFLGEIKGG